MGAGAGQRCVARAGLGPQLLTGAQQPAAACTSGPRIKPSPGPQRRPRLLLQPCAPCHERALVILVGVTAPVTSVAPVIIVIIMVVVIVITALILPIADGDVDGAPWSDPGMGIGTGCNHGTGGPFVAGPLAHFAQTESCLGQHALCGFNAVTNHTGNRHAVAVELTVLHPVEFLNG